MKQSNGPHPARAAHGSSHRTRSGQRSSAARSRAPEGPTCAERSWTSCPWRTLVATTAMALCSAFALTVAQPMAVPAGLAAQQPAAPESSEAAARAGFHFSIGLGGASVSASCPGCQISFIEDRISGLAGTLQIGGAVTPHLIVAVQGQGWIRNDDVFYRRLASLSVVTKVYPSATSGFFVLGGAGGLAAVVETDYDYAETRAWSAETGIGIDIPVGGSAKVTPHVSYVRTFGAQTWFNGFDSPIAVTPNAVQFGAALTIN
jgi:hypothetical protein